MATVVAWATIVLAALIGTPIAVGQIGWIIDIPIAVVAVAAAAIGLLYMRNERVGLEPGFLYRVNPIGIRKRWAISDLSEVVRVQALTGGGQMPTAILDADLVVDKRGRAVASFTGVWPEGTMTELWRAAALPTFRPWGGPVAVQTIRQRYPGALATAQEYQEYEGSIRQSLMALPACLGLALVIVLVTVVAIIVGALVFVH